MRSRRHAAMAEMLPAPVRPLLDSASKTSTPRSVAARRRTRILGKTRAVPLLTWAICLSLIVGAADLMLGPANMACAQGFGELRQSVRAPNHPEENKPKKKASHYDPCCDDDDDDGWGALLAPLAAPLVYASAAAVTSPFWGPAQLVGDDYDRISYFASFPYEKELDGFEMRDPWVPLPPQMWSARIRGDYADDFNDLSSIGGHVLWEHASRFGVDAETRFRQENTGPGDSDELWTGDANLLFRFAESPHLQMRAGLGFNWLADEFDQELGINFTYGGDWYPVEPLVFSGELDVGRLGRATYFHGRVTGGVILNRYEVFTGYDYFDVGDAQIQGFIGGLRIWF